MSITTATQIPATDLAPGDVVTIPAGMIGGGERRIVTSEPKVWPVSTGRVVEVDTRSEDWSRSGSLALPAETILTVSRGERREEVETHNTAAAAVAASDRVAIARQVARAEQASGGTVVTCGEHGAHVRSFGGSIGCTNTGESCDLSWGDLAGHADGRTLAWHHDFLTVSA